jgi:hypothetical protein
LPAIQTKRAHPHPPSPDSDVADLNVAFAGAELPPSVSGPVSSGAKVVRLNLHLNAYNKGGAISAADFFSENNSWGPQDKPLLVEALAAVIVGPDGLDPVLHLVNAAPGVGDGDNIEKLLADVGGDNEIATQRSQ